MKFIEGPQVAAGQFVKVFSIGLQSREHGLQQMIPVIVVENGLRVTLHLNKGG
jgi:hypothetical protein